MRSPEWRSVALRKLRLRGFDYTTSATYFVTIVTAQRRRLLSRIVNGRVVLTPLGEIVTGAWAELGARLPVRVGASVVMPDHVHGLIDLLAHDKPKSLGAVVGAFKAAVTRTAGMVPGTLWQQLYFDRIVRSDKERERFEQYIALNPERWIMDSHRTPGEELLEWRRRIAIERSARASASGRRRAGFPDSER